MSIEKAIGASSDLKLYESVDLWTNVDAYNVALLQSGYATFFDLRGAVAPDGEDWLGSWVPGVIRSLKSMFERPGVQIEFSFTRDPGRTVEMLDDSLKGARASAKNMGIDAEPLFQDMVSKLLEYVSYEGALIVFKSTMQALDPAERKRLQERRSKKSGSLLLGTTGGSPDFEVGETLIKNHEAMCQVFSKSLSQFLDLRKITAREGLYRLRKEVSTELTPRTWRPVLWGGKIPVRPPLNDSEDDFSPLFPPIIGAQLFPEPPEAVEGESSLIKVGGKILSPMYFELLPEHRSRFGNFFSLIPSTMPFRFTVSLESGANNLKQSIMNRRKFALFCSLTNKANREVVESIDYLLNKMGKKVPWVSVSAFVTTWGDTVEKAKENQIQMIQQAAAWGGAEVRTHAEQPFDCWLRSLPGVAKSTSAYNTIEPVDDVFSLLPIDRPAAIWGHGSLLLRSEDGKLLPMQQFSDIQTAWNNLVFANPGYGKSVFVLAKLLASIFAAGNNELPRQCLLDIGHSSEGYIDLLRAILPEGMKHQALLVVVSNTGDMRMNFFDIPLGYDRPENADMLAIESIMETIVSPALGEAEDILIDAAVMLAKRMFVWTSDYKPNLYTEYVDERIRDIVRSAGDDLHDKPTWLEVRDHLFIKGEVELAAVAQRQSVPSLIQASAVITEDEELKSAYGHEKLKNGSPVLETLKRLVSEAISNYPVIAGHSTLNFDQARVVAFNLRAVASDETAKMIKQSKVMYAVAKKAGAAGYFATDVKIGALNKLYYSYHKKISDKNMSRPKEITYEEFHVPAAMESESGARSPIVRQVEVEEKTGRKSSVGVNAVSQQFDDFSPKMIQNANSVFVLYAGEKKVKDLLKTNYGVRANTADTLDQHLTGPTSSGAPVFAMHLIKGKPGYVMQKGILSLGRMWLWALCSTESDVLLRRELAGMIGFYEALAVLVKFFPGGSIHGSKADEVKNLFAQIPGEKGKAVQDGWVRMLAFLLLELSPSELHDTLSGRRPLDESTVSKYLPSL